MDFIYTVQVWGRLGAAYLLRLPGPVHPWPRLGHAHRGPRYPNTHATSRSGVSGERPGANAQCISPCGL